MLETNIRIVRPGRNLYLWIRQAVVEGSDLSLDLLQRACRRLRYRYGLAATPSRSSRHTLLVATREPVPSLQLEEEDWVLTIQDAGEASQRVYLQDPEGVSLITELIGRAFVAELAHRSDLWTLESPRIWYEPEPFQIEKGIAAYRRFEIASLLIDAVGVGVAVDVGTAFFTEATLAYFFDGEIDASERRHRRELFGELTKRQAGQKGTLLYDNSRSRIKCHFEEAPEGVTCRNTGRLRVRGKTYESVYAYYRSEYPGLPVLPESRAVRVSFMGLDRPQYVAAEQVRIRVMNDNVIGSLSTVDKLDPRERRELLEKFWRQRGPKPLGSIAPGFYDGFWQPETDRVTRFPLVELEFGDRRSLPRMSPSVPIADYRTYYRQRLEFLENVGCYFVPPTVSRTLYYAYPCSLSEEAAHQAAGDVAAKISKWTKLKFTVHPVRYSTLREAIEQLRHASGAGMVIFVLNHEPSAYYEVASQLPDWRVKRITEQELRLHFGYLKNGIWDKRRRCHSPERGKARWEQFINLNALDILQQLDCIPWRTEQLGPYEAQVAIDVGHDRRYFSLSLLISRAKEKNPSIWVDSLAVVKSDHQHESINEIILAEQLVVLLQRARRSHFDAIRSLLIFRNGRIFEAELRGICQRAVPVLVTEGLLASDARVDVIDFRKESLTVVRLWETEGDQIRNPREGTAVQLTPEMVVVASTGEATVHQGTAQPFVLVGNGCCPAILDAAKAAFDAAQLNFSSPTVAQHDPLTLKRTDDELAARAAQEIKGIR